MTDQPRAEPGHGTPEGYTAEEPAVAELGQPGTPGAGMTPGTPHAADADAVEHGEAPVDSLATSAHAGPADPAMSVAHHDASAHTDVQTALADDDHGHAAPRLGPIDWSAWAYAVVGAASGLAVVVLFYWAVSR